MAVDFAFAVELIFVPLARRQLRLANRRIRRGETDLLAIQVVPVFDLPVQIQIVLVLLEVENKRLVGRDESRAAGRVKQSGKN
ncbi:hypothetical protein D3C71_1167940 [compost metagenome]